MELILASGSPRRRELLSLYTTDFTVCVSDFDESTVTADTPAHLVEQLARGKCLAVAKDHPDAVVIGCDTVVDVNGEVFGKPHGVEDAKRMLRALSGSAHQVHTGVCVSRGGRTESFVDSCKVTFFPLSEEEIDFYASTKEPYDKAGAYAIQGRAAPLAGPHRGRLLHHYGPAGQPYCTAGRAFCVRKMEKCKKTNGNA